jgi:bifunctional oligoribonuclease and PAP phosphatase NrnA
MIKERRQAAAKAIRQARKILIACHVRPDGDALGSLCGLGLACEALGKSVTIVSPDGVPPLYQFIPGSERVRTGASGAFDLGIGVDADGSDRLGSAEALVLGAPVVIDLDHHVGPEPFGDIRLVDPTAAATGELVYELLAELGAPIDGSIAEALMVAIVTDTGAFRYASVTPRTLEIAADLTARGAHPAPIVERVYGRRSFAATLLLGEALARVRRAAGGRLAWTALDCEAFRRAGARAEETEGIVNEIRAIEGVTVAMFLREEPPPATDGAGASADRGDGGPLPVRVSLRSGDGVDVAALAERFGGGGHHAAAGCTLPGPLSSAVEALVAAATEALKA